MQRTGRSRVISFVMVLGIVTSLTLGCHSAAVEESATDRFKFGQEEEADDVIQMAFAQVDQNDDDRIGALEYVRFVKQRSFRRLDTSGDGKISLGEWRAVEKGEDGTRIFIRLDKDLDGLLTLEEFLDAPQSKESIYHMFRTLDTDHNGYVTLNELGVERDVR